MDVGDNALAGQHGNAGTGRPGRDRFDYIVDHVQRTKPFDQPPETVVNAAIRYGDPFDVNNIGHRAKAAGRHPLAPHAFGVGHAMCAQTFGPERDETLLSHVDFAIALHDVGRFADAVTEHRAIIKIATKRLGPEHAMVLRYRNNLAVALFVCPLVIRRRLRPGPLHTMIISQTRQPSHQTRHKPAGQTSP